MSDLWQTLFKSLKINLNISTSHHPQTDGQTERVNQTIEIMLKFYVNQLTNNWDQYLDIVEYAYNNHETLLLVSLPSMLTMAIILLYLGPLLLMLILP